MYLVPNLSPSAWRAGTAAGWHRGSFAPTLADAPLPLDHYERSRSLAIHPDGTRFVLGTAWALRAFAADGKLLWRRAAPALVWAVNITGDGRLIVAGYADGTIRWHQISDGKELLAFLPLADRERWVAWTPLAGSKDAVAASASLLAAVASGEIASAEGREISRLIELHLKAVELHEPAPAP